MKRDGWTKPLLWANGEVTERFLRGAVRARVLAKRHVAHWHVYDEAFRHVASGWSPTLPEAVARANVALALEIAAGAPSAPELAKNAK